MALSYRTRKRLSLLILLVGLPVYIVAVAVLMDWWGRPPILVEFLVYIGSGVLWAFPLRSVFLGIGQADPDAPEDDRRD